MDLYIPTAVVLHTPEYSDVAKIQGCVGLQAPCEVWSFTDTHPRINEANEQLHDIVFFKADAIIIQQELVEQATMAVRGVINASMLTSIRRAQIGTFDRDYTYRSMSFDAVKKFMKASF